jgi:hypothetical protein
MISLEMLTAFLGWCSVINIGVLIFSTVAVMAFRSSIVSIDSKMFDLDEAELPKLYFWYLACYKIATLVFNLAPYIALKIML